MATSVAERVCGSLASTLAHVSSGQAMLETVEERDLFLRRTDEDGRWFRYHHLFAQFLQHRLERDQPKRIAELHRTGTAWFAEYQLLNEAVDHAGKDSAQTPYRPLRMLFCSTLSLIVARYVGALLS